MTPTPEFRSKSKASGKTYEVEPSARRLESAHGDVRNAEFQGELEGYVRTRFTARRRRSSRIRSIGFELSIPTMMARPTGAVARKPKLRSATRRTA